MKLAINIGYSGAQLRLPLELILDVERMGYDSVWTAEAYGSDAVTPLAYLAAKTTRIKLGTGIMQIPGRTPAMRCRWWGPSPASANASAPGRMLA